jgi:DNA-binding MarR family transcriptional regulator
MALLRLAQAVKKLSNVEADDAGLTAVQAQTLMFVRHTKTFLTSIGRLAAALGTTHVTAIGVVDGLVQRGLLRRETHPRDRRVTLLRLTPAGDDACRQLERFGGTLEASLAALNISDLANLERTLGVLVSSLRASGALQAAEPCRGCAYFVEDALPGASEPHGCGLLNSYFSQDESLRDCPDHLPIVPFGALAEATL